ncbi:hypothetical protein ACKWTF_012762 [Chironomus riparius]
MDDSNDLVLLERVMLKFGLCDTDDQFEVQVNKFLSPVLLKIESKNEQVRKKVMEILTHVNKRLKSRPNVKVDLTSLLKNYEESSNSFLTNFAIIYIIIGFPRLTIEEQIKLFPLLLKCIENKPEPHQNKLLMLLLPLLGLSEIEKMTEEQFNQQKEALKDRSNAKEMLLSVLIDILLLPYGHTNQDAPPPGFSLNSLKRITLKEDTADYLENLKKGIVSYLSKDIFEEKEIFPHMIVASSDSRFSVVNEGVNESNKISVTIDFDDPNNCIQLYNLFTGKDSKIKERKVSACSPRLKLKILNFLMKCRGPALIVPKGIQVIFEGLFGETTNQKVKVAVLQFAANLIQFGNGSVIEKLSEVLHTYITKLIGLESPEPSAVQNSALMAIAKLFQIFPKHFNKNVNLIVNYFDFLKGSTSDLHDSIKECLLALAQAFKWTANKVSDDEKMDVDGEQKVDPKDLVPEFVPTSNHIIILGILRDQCESKNLTSLNVTSFFLNTCFPQYFVPARYMLVWISGICMQLKEGVYTFLYGTQRKDHITYQELISCDTIIKDGVTDIDQKIILPSFEGMIAHIDEEFERKASKSKDKLSSIDLDVFTEVLDYARICLWYSAGCNCEPGTDNSKLVQYLINLKNKDCIVKYVKLIRSILIIRKSLTELDCLLDLYDSTPWIVCSNGIKISDTLKILANSLKDVNEGIRTKSAKIYGIHLAYDSTNDVFNTEITQLLNLSQKSLEQQHGCLLALSNACFYRIIYYIQNNKNEEWTKFVKSREYTELINLLVKLLNDQKSLLQLASLKGLSLLGCFALPFEDVKEENAENYTHSKIYVLNTVGQLLKSSHSKQKVREEAAICLGYLSIGDSIFFSKRVINHFLDMKRMTKDAALHISIARALGFIFSGDEHLPKEILNNMKNDDELLEWTLKELMKIVVEVNVCSRQAVSLWLLAVVKSCSKRKPILDKKRSLQMAFTHLLSENNELVQQVASKGLGIIYSICSEDDKRDMSKLLIENLTDGNKGVKQKVSEDTVLFEEGMLSKTPDGQNLSTYKDLCNMASEMNKPEMIYSFMELANHNANWNTKLGAAFSLQAISIEHAKENMQPFISKIVPKLFRYKYDPTPKIQNSMIQIWDSIVKDNNQTLDSYYWDILDDLTKNLTHPEWRTRIASTLALRDLIKRPNGLRLKSLESKITVDITSSSDVIYETELKFLWAQLYRVMDDFHEGTREAAEGTAKMLSRICVTAVSCDHGEKRSFLITNAVLPILLEGIVHVVQEIRFLSLKTISEMIDSTGSLIQPHLPILIPCLLRATGELDNTKLSMLSNMVSGQGGSQEIVDSMRAEEAKNHFTMNTLKKCVKYIDISTMEKANQSVLELIKNGVNLGTKVACADFVYLISLHLNKDFQPYAAKYLSACVAALSDRNPIVRKHYATAIGDLVTVAKDSTVISLFKKLTTIYFEDQEGKSRTIALTLQAINKKHADLLNSNASSILPLMFFAKHEAVNEENKSTVEMWQDLWNDVNFGDSLLQNHFNDILGLLETSINHQSWKLKAQSGSTAEALAKRLSDNLRNEERTRLIELIMENISGRTFNGKEQLIEALAALCDKSCNNELIDRVIQAVLRECRKDEESYKTKVLGCLGTILEKLETENRFEDVFNIVWSLLDKPITSNREQDTSNEERGKEKDRVIALKEAACDVLGKSWPSTKSSNSIDTQKKYQLLLISKLAESFKSNTRTIQMKLLVALGMFLEKSYLLNEVAAGTDAEDLRVICKLVMENIAEASGLSHVGLKKECLQIYIILLKKLKAINKGNDVDFITGEFEKIADNFQRDNSPEIKLRLQDIKGILK